MLDILWWLVIGPFAGWLTGRLLRTSTSAWMDAFAGVLGAAVAGTLSNLLGFTMVLGIIALLVFPTVGAIGLTVIYHKVTPRDPAGPRAAARNRSYTSYRSRMGK
jgi:uncharacterized membrane protein YeaQ/YmgE (transglycosylase-associated protein family)